MSTLKEFKGQDKPWPGDEGDVEEADEVPQESGNQHLEIFYSILSWREKSNFT